MYKESSRFCFVIIDNIMCFESYVESVNFLLACRIIISWLSEKLQVIHFLAIPIFYGGDDIFMHGTVWYLSVSR